MSFAEREELPTWALGLRVEVDVGKGSELRLGLSG